MFFIEKKFHCTCKLCTLIYDVIYSVDLNKFYFCCLALIAFNQCTKNVNVFNTMNRLIPTCSVILFHSMLNSYGIKIIFPNKHKLIFTGKTFLRYCVFSTKEHLKRFTLLITTHWFEYRCMYCNRSSKLLFLHEFFYFAHLNWYEIVFSEWFHSIILYVYLYVRKFFSMLKGHSETSAKFCSPSLGFWNWFSMKVKNPQ